MASSGRVPSTPYSTMTFFLWCQGVHCKSKCWLQCGFFPKIPTCSALKRQGIWCEGTMSFATWSSSSTKRAGKPRLRHMLRPRRLWQTRLLSVFSRLSEWTILQTCLFPRPHVALAEALPLQELSCLASTLTLGTAPSKISQKSCSVSLFFPHAFVVDV